MILNDKPKAHTVSVDDVHDLLQAWCVQIQRDIFIVVIL